MKRFIQNTITRFKSVPLAARIGVGAGLLALFYIGTFIVPANIQLSYSVKSSCVTWFMIAPGVQQQRAGKDTFQVEPQDVVKVFGAPLFSTKVCVTPTSAPHEGEVGGSIAPFALPIFSKAFVVSTPASPTAHVAKMKGAEVSAVKPLVIPFDAQDVIQKYTLRMGDKIADCKPTKDGLSCAMEQLELESSTAYALSLYRGFGSDSPKKIETIDIKTLAAVQLVDATLKNDATVYDKPADFRFTFDQQLESAEGVLKQADGKTITAAFTTDGATLVVAPEKPLARNAKYTLTLQHVTGKNGGSLADPIVAGFTMSGGPKVASISVGDTLIAPNARIVVTFDQTIKADTDVAKLVHISGADGSIVKASDNSVAITLASAPLCGVVTVGIDKGIPSGSNDETSSDPWKFDGRITCGSSRIVGYSVRGRAIVAYTFGTGASSILFTGGIHGSEPSGTTTMQAWVDYLQANGYKIPADKTVVIVPNTNPDGIAAGSRNNVNNVNVDRNFPAANWRPDIDTAGGTLATGGGTSAGSEPEAQALINLTRQLRPRLAVSFHAQGRLVGANQYGDSVSIGTTYANTVGYQTMIGNAEEVMGYSITGEYEDWMGEEMTIPAILIELPSAAGNYLTSQMSALMKVLAV